MFAERTSEVWRRVESLVQNEGLGLYDLELLAGGLKVTLHSKDGVKSGDCSRICKRLVVLASVEGENLGIGSAPQIEVNSPGINRTLRINEHFAGAVGERVKLVIAAGKEMPGELPIELPKELVAQLVSFESDTLKLVTKEGSKKAPLSKEWEVPLSIVKKARVDFEF